MEIKFEQDSLAVEQNKYLTKIVYIVYDLDAWSKIPLRNFILKNCLFGATTIVKTNDKEKYVYSGYGIAFNGKNQWSFGNYYARNVVTFGVDTSSSSHIDNCKNKFSVLGEGDTFGINGRFGAPEKKFTINFTEANTKFCLSLHYDGDNGYLSVNTQEIYKFK